MPAAQRGSAYKLGRGRWGVRYRDNGKLRRESPFPSKESALAHYRDVIAPRLRGEPELEPVLTLSEHVERYLRVHSCSRARRRSLRSSLAPALAIFGDRLLPEIAAGEVAEWAASQSRAKVMALRQVLGAAVDWELIPRNPADRVRLQQVRSAEVAAFEDTEEIDTVAFELGSPWAQLVVLASETGVRPEEWAALERRDVDRTAGVLLVRRAYTVDGGLKSYGKTVRSRRAVPLSDRAVAALDGLPAQLRTPLLFPTFSGGYRKGDGVGDPGYLNLRNCRKRQWTPALRAAGLERDGKPWLPVPYVLRHTFATWALEAGFDIFQLARYMGTSVAMIDRTYGHLARGHADQARDRLNRRPSIVDADEAEERSR
jgi:integrase